MTVVPPTCEPAELGARIIIDLEGGPSIRGVSASGYDEPVGVTSGDDEPAVPGADASIGGLFGGLSQRLGADAATEDAPTSLDLLELPDLERRVMRALMRGGETTAEALGSDLEIPGDEITQALSALQGRGMVEPSQARPSPTWRPVLGRRRSRIMPGGVWDSLGDRLT